MGGVNINVFRTAAHDVGRSDNVNLVMTENGLGLTTTKARGGVNALAGLFNVGRRAAYGREMLDSFKNALRSDFMSRCNNLSDVQCMTSVNRAFTAAFGMDFERARAKALKLNPKMIRAALAHAENELRELKSGGVGRPEIAAGPRVDVRNVHPLRAESVNRLLGGWLSAIKLTLAGQFGVNPHALDGLTEGDFVSAAPRYDDRGVCTNVKDFLPKKQKDVAAAFAANVCDWAKRNLPGVELPSAKRLARAILATHAANLETREYWANIRTTCETRTNDGPLTLVSDMTAGCNLGGQIYGNPDTGGHTSGDRKTSDLPNVWKTELTVQTPGSRPKKVFSAVRHAVCSAFGLSDPARRTASLQRAKGLAKAAFLSRSEELLRGGHGAGTRDNPISFNVMNVSLLSPLTIGSLNKEKGMVRDQRDAFRAINADPEPIEVRMDDGRTVFVKPHFTMFNFTVNEFGHGGIGGVFGSYGLQDQLNREALPALREHVGAFLRRDGVDDYTADVVKRLMSDVERILADKKSQHVKTDLYKASSRIVVLAHLIGDVPSFNCKSGKDRTGQNDAEAKFLATLIDRHMPIPEPGQKLTPEQSRIFRDLVVGSGNLEVQERNTGLGGYKTYKNDGNVERMGEDPGGLFHSAYKGGAKFVSS
ncbi:MAG: hypothetical protein MJ138_06315 [Kiritimatiellae bacterium]|nr:hypothetical protein [Kiritimatiellia bacterium]